MACSNCAAARLAIRGAAKAILEGDTSKAVSDLRIGGQSLGDKAIDESNRLRRFLRRSS